MNQKNIIKKIISVLTIFSLFFPFFDFTNAGLVIVPTCNDECSYYGQPCPNGGTCGNYDSDSCLECPINSLPPTCTDECSYYGQKRCSSTNYYQVCGNYDADSCLEWSSPTSCPSGQVCQNGQCVTTCTNECSYAGQKEKRCDCSRYLQERTCGNYDSDPCLEWSSWQTIQDCGTSSWTSEYRCSGNIVQRKYINRGCSNLQCFATEEWRNVEDCSTQGKVCQNGQCVTTCTNECSYVGQVEKRCSGSYVQKRTCGNYDSDPCLEWSEWQNEQNCGTSGWTNNYRCASSRYLEREYVNRGCSNNQCFSNSEWRQVQDCGTDSWTDNYRCSGNWVQREKIRRGCSNNACYQNSVWENVEDCSTQGKVCQNGQCVLPTCNCSQWSSWQDKGCGQGGCTSNQMWQERTRRCTPSGCASESETRCVEDVRCIPNDPIRGTLTVSSSTSPCIGESVTFTISAQDNQGVEKVCLDTNCQNCNFQPTCTKTWQIAKNQAGTFIFAGTVYGKRPDGSQESAQTNPSSISVTWRDCNRPPIANAGPDKEVLETQNVILEGSGSDPDGDSITFSWTCSGGTLSNSNIAQPTFTAPAISSDTSFVCTLTVTDSKGASASDSANVLVRNQTLSVILEAIPNSGPAPLNNVDLKATVSGTAIGTINYKFDCTSDGTFERVITTNKNPYTAVDLCNYAAGGTYNAKVIVERGAAEPAWAQATVTVSSPAPVVDLKVNGSDGPITVPYNSAVNLAWKSSNVTSCYASGDWSGTKSISGSETISSITSQKVFTIHCSGPGGSTSDSVTVYVSSLSFNVSLSASPSSGCVPLSNVSLTANVSRNFSGDLTYYFDCTSDGSWERLQTTSQNSLTASNLCNYSSTGIYYAKVRVEGAGTSREASTPINVSSCYTPYYPSPTVDIKVNGRDDYITVTSGSSVTLTWSSSNANFCQASGDWSGIKAISGSETIAGITSSKVFTITCTGSGGSAVDSVTVNVALPVSGIFSVNKTVRNLSKGTAFLKSINAEPGEVLSFAITITAGQNPVYNLTVRDTLPTGILYGGDLKLNNITIAGDILAGINIGNLAAGETKTITFVANIAGPNSFSFGQTELTNTVSVSSETSSLLDTAKVIVSKKAVAGAATGIGTGLTNNVLLDSFILPLLLTLILVWLFRTRIINFEKWIDEKKRSFQEYKAQKLLQMKVLQEKARELVKR